jgi:hypothetical protein
LYFTAVARVGADQKWKNMFISGLYLDFILSNVVTFYTERVVTNHATVFSLLIDHVYHMIKIMLVLL